LKLGRILHQTPFITSVYLFLFSALNRRNSENNLSTFSWQFIDRSHWIYLIWNREEEEELNLCSSCTAQGWGC
jgi:hypothetical protein